MKKCRRCGKDLPLEEFYTHPRMADGHLNICKECTKKRVSKHRESHIDNIRAYDRERAKLPHRKEKSRKITKKRRHEVEGYEAAHMAVEHAVKSGKIIKPNQCQCCGHIGRLEAHHHSYSKKLSIIWLCSACHKQYHFGKTKRAETIRLVVDSFFKGETKWLSN